MKVAVDKYGQFPVYAAGLLFVACTALFIYREFYLFLLLPVLPAVLYMAFFAPSRLFLAVVFFTPLSVELSRYIPGLPFDVSLPTEPVILVLLGIMLLRHLHTGLIPGEVVRHPVTLAILFYLGWMFVTSLTSTMPLVSFKYLAAQVWFVGVFYLLAVIIFVRRRYIDRFLWCYAVSLALVAIYTLYNHSAYGLFTQREAHWVVRPFYNDHTAYGAALALFLPVVISFAFRRKKKLSVNTGEEQTGGLNLPFLKSVQTAAILLSLFFVIALVFSYSRAAWLSVFAAAGALVLVILRIRFRTILLFGSAAALMMFLMWGNILREMEKNTQDSSADFREHVRSMTNITSDASNLERINRWHAAIGMFCERPVFGWGPGTYMFVYAPFQYSYNRTIISTNLADGGDAHSEYLGPLSESGFFGLLGFIAVGAAALTTGFRLVRRLSSGRDRLVALGVVLGLVTYLVHGTLNNFLSSDKAAVPFWGFIAIIVSMDLYRKKRTIKTSTSDSAKL